MRVKISWNTSIIFVQKNSGFGYSSRGKNALFEVGTRSYVQRLGVCPYVGCAKKNVTGPESARGVRD